MPFSKGQPKLFLNRNLALQYVTIGLKRVYRIQVTYVL